jgi:hypothetical protein
MATERDFPYQKGQILADLFPEIDAEPERSLARDARLAAIAASDRHHEGSIDRDTALKLEADFTAAASACRVRERELANVFAAKGAPMKGGA